MFLILGYLCNAQTDTTDGLSPAKGAPTTPAHRLASETHESDHFSGLFFKSLLPSNPESVLPSGVHI